MDVMMWSALIGKAVVCDRFPEKFFEIYSAPHKIKDQVMFNCVSFIGGLNELLATLRPFVSSKHSVDFDQTSQDFKRDLHDRFTRFKDAYILLESSIGSFKVDILPPLSVHKFYMLFLGVCNLVDPR
jgi:hypothetical protein